MRHQRDGILLSIAIPTRNQPEALRITLQSIMPQLAPDVEIVIGDNSTNNETELLITQSYSHPQIRYLKNGADLGIDKNILSITENARGIYVWWFGDDGMDSGAIAHVLGILRKYPEMAMIFVNSRISGRSDPAVNLGKDKFFKDRNQVLDEIGSGLTFASSIIFKKDALRNVDQKKLDMYMGSQFVNFYLTMHVLSGEGGFYFVSTPYVICYPVSKDRIVSKVVRGAAVNNDYFEIFGVTLFRIVHEFKDKFERRSIRCMLAKNFGTVWRGVLVGWVGGWDTPKGKRWQMFRLYWSYPEYWLALIAFLMPLSINRGLYRMYRVFFKERKWRLGGRR